MSAAARFAPQARADIAQALNAYGESPAAMRRFQIALATAARRIGAHPAIGRRQLALADERYRFWSLQGFPYLVVYRPSRTPPLIVRVVHTARDLGPLLAGLAETADEDPLPE